MKNDLGQQTLESMSQAVWYNRWTMKKFLPFLKGDILEVGCGIGNFTKSLLSHGRVWAIDIDSNYLNQTKKLVGSKAKVGFGNIEKGNYFFNDKRSSSTNKSFDTIICLNVLEHIKNDKDALKNIFKLLKSNGHLILLVPTHNFLYGGIDKSIGHFRRYEKLDLLNLLNKLGFKILKSKVINFLGAFGWWISSRLLFSDKVDEEKIKIFNFIAPFALPLENLLEPPIGTSILIIARK